MAYWGMKMKQGAKGEDFASELWEQNLVGVLFGTWTIYDVTDGEGNPVREKVTAEAISVRVPQPEGIKDAFSDRFLSSAKRFLLEVEVGDRVVVVTDGAVNIATISEGFVHDPNPPRGKFDEVFKCRRIEDKKAFPLSELPSSYRLLTSWLRQALQKADVYKPMIELLDTSESCEEVRERLATSSTVEFLEMLSPDQWEIICNEYLRSKVGLRTLLLDVGRTLKAVDIVGVDREGNRVLAQCKNDSTPWNLGRVARLIADIPHRTEDRVYLFCRGGIEGDVGGLNCTVVDGDEVAEWLESEPDYFTSIRTM